MINRIYILLTSFFFFQIGYANKINPKNIEIIRDSWGVPHIYAPTDEEVAYGLAWATAEDDFSSMQESFLTARGRLAEVKGKDGAIMDFVAAVLGSKDIVNKYYNEHSFSPKFQAVLEAYVQGVNDYIQAHPEKLWLKDLGKVTVQDILIGHTLGMALMTNVPYNILKITNGTMGNAQHLFSDKGSNAFALNSKKTTDGRTYLAINSHQPLAGPFSWYEAHLHSDEGWDCLGGTFPGGATIFHGTNKNLAWAHTVSFADMDDVYELTMHPRKKNHYLFNGRWLELQEKVCKMKVKIWGFIKIPVKKKYYESVYGPTLEYKGKYYAMRFSAAYGIKAPEQWYQMNKAKNFDEFKKIVQQQHIIGLNIVYADKEDNIYYLDNAKFPYRDKKYNWWKVLPGDTSATLWNEKQYYPYESLVYIENPKSGFVFNTNGTPYLASGKADNESKEKSIVKDFYFPYKNNRSIRLSYLLNQYDKIDYETFKTIKYDQSYHTPAYTYVFANMEDMLQLDPKKYSDIADAIKVLRKWNRDASIDNKQASLAAIINYYYIEKLIETGNLPSTQVKANEWFLVDLVKKAKKHMLKHFGSLEVPLGDVQKLVRGNKALPVSGIPDVIAAMQCTKYKKGILKADVGDSYILLVQFDKAGPILESINAYGASNVEGNKHYDDQMDLFVQQKLKPMSMDKATILKTAEKVYHPMIK